MPETAPLYPEMRVVEFLRFRAELKRVARRGPRRVGRRRHGQGRRPRRGQQAHRPPLQGVPPARRPRRRHRGASRPSSSSTSPPPGSTPTRSARRAPSCATSGATTPSCSRRTSSARSRRARRACCCIHQGKLLAEGPTEAIRGMRSATSVELVAARRRRRSGEGACAASRAWPRSRASAGRAPGRADVRLRAHVRRGSSPDVERGAATERCVAALVAAGGGRARGAGRRRLARGRVRRAHPRGRAERRGGRMRAFWPIYKRELFAFFVTPLAWVLIVVFLVVQGMHFFLLVDHFATPARRRRATRRRCRPSSATPSSSTSSSSCSSRR